MASPQELAAMRRALELAVTPGVPRGPNPRVGCVLLTPDGRTLAEGYHRGAGLPHAEVEALRQAGAAASGATAVVTLEPCDHTGRTGPCSQALLEAAVARVVFAQPDTSPLAGGGGARLAAAGVDVEGGVLADEAREVNEAWSFAVDHRRPFVTWKVATSLDGRVAAADGTSRWVTGEVARRDVHSQRSRVDAVIVGTGTALADDPSLTVRDDSGQLAQRQPTRVVVGRRDLPGGAALRDGSAPLVHLRTHQPGEVLADLFGRGLNHVLLEGGPTVAGAFLDAGLVDEVVAYVAPALLGPGPPAAELPHLTTLADALRYDLVSVERFGDDVRLICRPRPSDRSSRAEES